jgi:hypothetical protein
MTTEMVEVTDVDYAQVNQIIEDMIHTCVLNDGLK